MELIVGAVFGALSALALLWAREARDLARKAAAAELVIVAKEKRLDERLTACELEVNRVRQQAGIAPKK